MGAREFGLWVEQKRSAWVDPQTGKKGMRPGRLATRIGELSDGRTFDTTGVKLILSGRRRDYDTELVVRIAQALGEDSDVACQIAGVFPPDLEVEHVKRARFLMRTSQAPFTRRYPVGVAA